MAIRLIKKRVLLRDRLRKVGVINTHDLLKKFGVPGKTDVAVHYYRPEPRMVRGPHSNVFSPSHKTDPQAHWSDHGCKAFTGNRAESSEEAIAWATEKYGIKEWVPDPTGMAVRVPKSVRDAVMAALEKVENDPGGVAQGG